MAARKKTMADVGNYVNTIIFCVVCNLLLVALIVLLFMGTLDSLKYLLITLELCLLLIIIHAIFSIYTYEKRKRDAARQAAEQPLPVETCPEYYMRQMGANNSIECRNQYVTPDMKSKIVVFGANNASDVKIDMTKVLGKKGEYVCQEYRSKWTSVPWTDMQAHCETI